MWIYNPFNPPPINLLTEERLLSPYTKAWNRLSLWVNRFIIKVLHRTHVEYEVQGARYYHWPERCLIVANHSGFLDIPIITAGLPIQRYISFLAKRELFEHPIARAYFCSTGTLGINRSGMEKESVKSIKQVYKMPNWVMAMFPEGTRGDGETLLPMKGGAGYIIASNRLDFVPLGIYRIKKRVQVFVGRPVRYAAERSREETNDLVEAELHRCFARARELFYEKYPHANPEDRRK